VPVPSVETFEVWAGGLRRSLDRLGPDAADPLVAAARELVWPQRDPLLAMAERVRSLGEAARSRPAPRVLCHGDLIVDNLLMDRRGRLWAVDWEGAALAPRELVLPAAPQPRRPGRLAGRGTRQQTTRTPAAGRPRRGPLVPVALGRAGGADRARPPGPGLKPAHLLEAGQAIGP
jgi:hypothetical protein